MRMALFIWVLCPLLILTSGVSASAQNYCGTLFFEDSVFADFHHKVMTKKVTFDQVLVFLKMDSRLDNLFYAPNGAPGQPSIEAHSRDVFVQWRKQAPPAERLHYMPLVIALHDIGKPLAIQSGDRDRQHFFTAPLVGELMEKYQFEEFDIRITQRLLLNTSLPRLLKGLITAEKAAEEIHAEAFLLRVKPLDFFNWKLAFFSADAGSYHSLREHLFTQDSKGKLIAKSPQVEALKKLLTKNPTIPSASE